MSNSVVVSIPKARAYERSKAMDRLANSDSQGGVYQMIMEKVIQASQNDFEESGVDQSTLDEMKQVCCNLAAISAIAPAPFLCRASALSLRHHFTSSFLISILLVNRFLASFSLATTIARWLPCLGVMGG